MAILTIQGYKIQRHADLGYKTQSNHHGPQSCLPFCSILTQPMPTKWHAPVVNYLPKGNILDLDKKMHSLHTKQSEIDLFESTSLSSQGDRRWAMGDTLWAKQLHQVWFHRHQASPGSCARCGPQGGWAGPPLREEPSRKHDV